MKWLGAVKWIGLFLLAAIVILGLSLRGNWGNPRPNEIVNGLTAAGEPFESTLSRGRYVQTMSLVEDGTAYLDQEKALVALPDLGVTDGRAYPLFAPGLAYLNVPAYWLGLQLGATQLAVYGFMGLISVLAGLMIMVIVRAVGGKWWMGMFAALVFLFGTSAYPYGVTLAQHNLTVLCMLSIFLAGLLGPKNGWWYGLGWAAYGLAIFVDYPNLVFLMPAMIYMMARAIRVKRVSKYRKRFSLQTLLVVTAVVFGLIGVWHGRYNLTHFGAAYLVGPAVYEHVQNADEMRQALAGTLESGEVKNVTNTLFHPKLMTNGLYVLLLSRGRGLLVYAPVALLGLLGLLRMSKGDNRGLAAAFGVSMILNLMVYSSFGDPWGGWEYGPRYLILSFSLLSIGLGYSFHFLRQWWYKVLVLGLFGYGAFVNILGVMSTNQLPAEVEAVPLGLEYTYTYNWRLINEGWNASFVYRTWIGEVLSSTEYTMMVWSLIVVLASGVLLVGLADTTPVQAGRRKRT